MNLTPGLTAAGLEMMKEALDGDIINFTRIALGDGYYGSTASVTDMASTVMDLTISAITKGDNYVLLTSYYDNTEVDDSLRIREIGIFAENAAGEESLYAYGYDNDNPEVIPSYSTGTLIESSIQVVVSVGEAECVTAVLDDLAFFVTKEDFQAHLDAENPHGVTPSMIGAVSEKDLEARLTAYAVTIPADGWTAAGTAKGSYAYFCDVEAEAATAARTPVGSVLLECMGIAQAAGMASACETYSGYVRFYAEGAPAADISAVLMFL